MTLKAVFWPAFRVTYFVDVIFWVSVLSVRTFPPQDGNYARAFVGSLLVCTLTLVVAWAFVPWPRPEKAHGTAKR